MWSGDTVIHTFDTIGVYLISLLVRDDDGCVDWAYDTIKVKPTGANDYLTFWVDDINAEKPSGYWKKQCWVNKTNDSWNWKCWEEDIAGNGSWQHVVVDVTDTLAEWAQDSVTIAFRIYCANDSNVYNGAVMYVDDVYLFGGTVRNYNFENPLLTSWSGYSNDNSDGIWLNKEYTPTSALLPTSQHYGAHSGTRAILMGYHWQTPSNIGDYACFYQRVDVD
jgi:hypothetical protein